MKLGRRSLVPVVPALVAGPRGAWLLTSDGAIEELALSEVGRRLAGLPAPLLCHAPAVARRIDAGSLPAHDLLELFAFVRPAQFCLPTVRGLAAAAGLPVPANLADEAAALPQIAGRLLGKLAVLGGEQRREAAAVAARMAAAGWNWALPVQAALDVDVADGGLDVWTRLPEWIETAPPPPPRHAPVLPAEARSRLAALLGDDAEPRPEQADYASACALAFAPSEEEGRPRLVLAEAGTGVGKTLGYIAPASVWAEKNDGPVWLSTFTKNLQRQIDGELDRLYPQPRLKSRKAVVRKGRENYLCLLNLDEAVQGIGLAVDNDAVALGLMARWARASRDGDMVGGDFPAWLVDLVGRRRTRDLTDRRGECVYAACPHYRKCFIERAVRHARQAEMVIANHALVMNQAAHGADEDPRMTPTRYVFDEGHHLFDVADSVFSAALTGAEAADLRRWLRGVEDGGRSRARGLKRRIGDLVAEDEAAAGALERALAAAAQLPGAGWQQRLRDGQPRGAAERFLAAVHRQVRARAVGADGPYGIETDARPPVDGLPAAAAALKAALQALIEPMAALEQGLARLLDTAADSLDTPARLRIDATCRGLYRRRVHQAEPWRAMLYDLSGPMPDGTVEWMAIDRSDGRDVDVGMHRHWIDPTGPFVEAVLRRAHGAVITSATLCDAGGDPAADWAAAEAATGAVYLEDPAVRASLRSPFDYAAATRVLVVTDVARDSTETVAAAFRSLFLAAGGGGLGLFTAISRLRAVHQRLLAPLDAEGIALLAQHADTLDPATLVEIFRAERDACLLGTDAMRDGVDVPGPSLRLIVFDRVPWPRPTILHRARRDHFGGRSYDDRIARLRLRQAFGRLVRRADDFGVFVLLDGRTPSRLLGGFPEGVEARRVGLAEAVRETREFIVPRLAGAPS